MVIQQHEEDIKELWRKMVVWRTEQWWFVGWVWCTNWYEEWIYFEW